MSGNKNQHEFHLNLPWGLDFTLTFPSKYNEGYPALLVSFLRNTVRQKLNGQENVTPLIMKQDKITYIKGSPMILHLQTILSILTVSTDYSKN